MTIKTLIRLGLCRAQKETAPEGAVVCGQLRCPKVQPDQGRPWSEVPEAGTRNAIKAAS
jgi:hypothetical protein